MDACHTPLISFAKGSELDRLPEFLRQLGNSGLLIAASQHAVDYAQKELEEQNILALWDRLFGHWAEDSIGS